MWSHQSSEQLKELELYNKVKITEAIERIKDLNKLENQLIVACNGKTYLLKEIAELKQEQLDNNHLKNIFFLTQTRKVLSLSDLKKALETNSSSINELIYNRNLARLLPSITTESPLCPILATDLHYPYITIYGHDFSLPGIILWIEKHSNCPFTRKNLTTDDLIPNIALQDLLWALYKHDWTNNKKSINELIKETDTHISFLTAKKTALEKKQANYNEFKKYEPELASGNLNTLNNLDFRLRLEQREKELRLERYRSFFAAVTSVSFYSGVLSLFFLGTMIANPILGLAVGSILVLGFTIGVIGQIASIIINHNSQARLDERLDNISRIKRQNPDYTKDHSAAIEMVQARIHQAQEQKKELEQIRDQQGQLDKKMQPSKVANFFGGLFSCGGKRKEKQSEVLSERRLRIG